MGLIGAMRSAERERGDPLCPLYSAGEEAGCSGGSAGLEAAWAGLFGALGGPCRGGPGGGRGERGLSSPSEDALWSSYPPIEFE